MFLATALSMTGCGASSIALPYKATMQKPMAQMRTAQSFASNLCVAAGEVDEVGVTLDDLSCAGLFDVNESKTLYAKGVFDRIAPASLTKVMTAYVAMKYGNLNQVITATANVNISESGAQLIGIKKGDKMTLSQALHILLIYSANDVALMIAENIAGSVNEFVTMMNNEALMLGATSSHFENPHGLHAQDHYMTVYDMYLVFNAALQYQEFVEIIRMPAYTTTYTTENGTEKEIEVNNTNLFLRDAELLPDSVVMAGGKTGTTTAAGHCLIVSVKNAEGKPFIAVVMRAKDHDTLYDEMTQMLSKI